MENIVKIHIFGYWYPLQKPFLAFRLELTLLLTYRGCNKDLNLGTLSLTLMNFHAFRRIPLSFSIEDKFLWRSSTMAFKNDRNLEKLILLMSEAWIHYVTSFLKKNITKGSNSGISLHFLAVFNGFLFTKP